MNEEGTEAHPLPPIEPGLASAFDSSAVLDPAQLARIEGTHRGFLYQHLYAVACLLQPGRTWTRLYSERDEDVELSSPARHVYVQVKSRQRGDLHPSDVESTLSRFAALHLEHTTGKRPSEPAFVIVTNAEPTAALLQQVTDYSFAVSIVSPTRPPSAELGLPLAPPDVPSAVQACTSAAAAIPFCKLAPTTLTWKLAGFMGLVSSGTNAGIGHAVEADSLPHVFEQLTKSAQTWPSVPARFYESEEAPPICVEDRLRIIRGAPGAGKSSWAAFALLHTPRSVTYFDARNAHDNLAAEIAREVTFSTFHSRGDVASDVLAPGRSGVAALAVLDQYLSDRDADVEVFLDNAHLVDQEQLTTCIGATKHMRWTLLARPSAAIQLLGQRFELDASDLPSWSATAVAEEANAIDVIATPAAIERVLSHTGGNPLFIRSALRLARRLYAGSVESLLDALATGTHLERTLQEEVCGQLVDSLNPSEICAAFSLAHAGIELRQAELVSIMLAAAKPEISAKQAAASLRQLIAEGIASASEAGLLRLHDSFHLHLLERLEGFGADRVCDLDQGLEKVLRARAFERDLPVPHLVRFVEVLHRVGRLDEVTDLVSGIVEYLEEHGVTHLVARVLRAIEANEGESPSVRFWAADTFAFLAAQNRDVDSLAQTTERMEGYLEDMGQPPHEYAAWANKRVCLAGLLRDAQRLRSDYDLARKHLDGSPEFNAAWRRALEYNYASLAAQLGDYAAAAPILRGQVSEYLTCLGLKPIDVGITKLVDLKAAMGNNWSFDDAKRLGDVLEALALCEEGLGYEPTFERIHASKFFAVAEAIRSCLRVGLAEVHRLLHVKHDARSAWELLSLIAPAATEAGSFEFTVDLTVEQVRVLNYLGEFGKREAQQIYEHLRPLLRAARASRLENELDQLLSSPPILRSRSYFNAPMPSSYSTLAMDALAALKFGAPFNEDRSFPPPAGAKTLSLTREDRSRSCEPRKQQTNCERKRQRKTRRKQRGRK